MHYRLNTTSYKDRITFVLQKILENEMRQRSGENTLATPYCSRVSHETALKTPTLYLTIGARMEALNQAAGALGDNFRMVVVSMVRAVGEWWL